MSSPLVSTPMSERQREAVERRLRGETLREIGDAMGISHQRVVQLIQAAGESARHKAQVRIVGTDGVGQQDVADYVRRALESAGITVVRDLE